MRTGLRCKSVTGLLIDNAAEPQRKFLVNMKKIVKFWTVISILVLLVFSNMACFVQNNAGKAINSADDLKAYLDKQPANSADKPIKVAMKVNDIMLASIVKVINNTGKYVYLDLTGSPLTAIPNQAFTGLEKNKICTTLIGITIPESITSIGSEAFGYCLNLTTVTFQGTIPSSQFQWNAFYGNFYIGSEKNPSNICLVGDLRYIFYASNSTNGTPGTYTRSEDLGWTKQP
jgi:hypothetical protein